MLYKVVLFQSKKREEIKKKNLARDPLQNNFGGF